MKPIVRTAGLLLLLLGSFALAGAFTPPSLRRQNAMRMSYHDNQPLTPPTDDDLEALERRLPPSVAAWLRLASAVVMGGAYLASPVMGAWGVGRGWPCVNGVGLAWVWFGLRGRPRAGFALVSHVVRHITTYTYIHTQTAPRPAEAVTSTTVLTGNVMEATCLGTS